jgi:hypothetical protein
VRGEAQPSHDIGRAALVRLLHNVGSSTAFASTILTADEPHDTNCIHTFSQLALRDLELRRYRIDRNTQAPRTTHPIYIPRGRLPRRSLPSAARSRHQWDTRPGGRRATHSRRALYSSARYRRHAAPSATPTCCLYFARHESGRSSTPHKTISPPPISSPNPDRGRTHRTSARARTGSGCPRTRARAGSGCAARARTRSARTSGARSSAGRARPRASARARRPSAARVSVRAGPGEKKRGGAPRSRSRPWRRESRSSRSTPARARSRGPRSRSSTRLRGRDAARQRAARTARRAGGRTVAHVVLLAAVVRDEVERVIRRDVLRVLLHELCAHVSRRRAPAHIHAPLVASQSVGIVSTNSMREIVKP